MVAQLTEYSKLLHHSSPSKLCEWRYMTCTIPRKRAPEEADMPTSNYWPSAPTAVVAQLTEFSNLLPHSSPSCARGGTLVLLLALPLPPVSDRAAMRITLVWSLTEPQWGLDLTSLSRLFGATAAIITRHE